ncbi:unnamed protein product, partial [Nesidiocoris tenuis]
MGDHQKRSMAVLSTGDLIDFYVQRLSGYGPSIGRKEGLSAKRPGAPDPWQSPRMAQHRRRPQVQVRSSGLRLVYAKTNKKSSPCNDRVTPSHLEPVAPTGPAALTSANGSMSNGSQADSLVRR